MGFLNQVLAFVTFFSNSRKIFGAFTKDLLKLSQLPSAFLKSDNKLKSNYLPHSENV